MLLAVGMTLATPFAAVVTTIEFKPLLKTAPAEPVGEVNVTFAFATGWFALSVTSADSATPNAVLIDALCGVPPCTAIDALVEERFVSVNAAGLATPLATAPTVY